ncbi:MULTISPECIES: ribosomal protection-like ABC-F family protein [unclassified Exiguobacterium]|uniref:ribosomal protection-like ABC-F family protein n=1 Tax=unclassified Exiguobacterium TaxID=2644629 RepID=UPI00103C9143|nr:MULTISPECIES: ABC-F family ATP-binding cassette domain-containing protein [unclassified Exiguobacterium]TCI45996.1 ABC-F family ATP-binding cassette domain-containing protein [Exiguobacterium sp. SH5S32]TCI51753.1 ABC-F family ATP-binding cassette domain-containing protein [Exiguobacterium sp. SH1S4]TCI71739.1 ABC-F family ATP-binding cassette domain-containing protein [Exiguobacterium sp. SH1S1]
MLSVHQVRFDYDQQPLFDSVSFDVSTGERAVLFGQNGSGKTTLFKLLVGKLSPQAGRIEVAGKVGVVEQTVSVGDGTTLAYVMKGDSERFRLYEEVTSGDTERVLAVYDEAMACDAFGLEAEANQALKRIGMDGMGLRRLSDLSGGEQTRAQLARLMMRHVDVVLLDEPTNHLDVDSIDWLTRWVREFPGTVLAISHDRQFIDDVATVILELSDGEVVRYPGNYSAYKQQKAEERVRDERAHARYVARKSELLDMIAQYKGWHLKAKATASVRSPGAQKGAANLAVKMKARQRKLDQLEQGRPDKPKDAARVSVRFQAEPLEAKTWITVENVVFGYDEPLFEHLSFTFNRGDRLSIVGPNGSGKTTLLKLLLGQLEPNEGAVHRHPKLKIGYFSQTLERLPEDGTLLDALLSASDIPETEARTLLAHFLFRRDDVYKPMREASMGEKCRIAFLILYFSDADMLALDEPTNYLDVATREQIEAALSIYRGGLILISHDRTFHQLTDRMIELGETVRILEAGQDTPPIDVEATIQTLEALTNDEQKFVDEAGNVKPFDESEQMRRNE